MSLVGKFYDALMLAWFVLAFAAWAAVDLGHTEPWLTFADVPGGSVGAFAIAMGVAIVGLIPLGYLKARWLRGEWAQAGRQAGLGPAGDGRFESDNEIAGTVDGRTVTARYEKRNVGGGNEGSSRVTFTFSEAALSGPADEGVIGGPVDGKLDAGIGTIRFEPMAENVDAAAGLAAVETGGLVLVGTSTAAVEAVADSMAADAERTFPGLKTVAVGDAAGVVAEWSEARNAEMEGVGSSLAEYPVDNLVESVPGDAGSVTVEMMTSMWDADQLRRTAEGTVAVADAFEAATAGTPGA